MAKEIRKISKEQAWEIRHVVMWPDKDFDYIKLADDDDGFHYGLFQENQLISVISLFLHFNEAQIRKFATLETEQGKGYGSELLHFVLKEVENTGVERIWCNARTNKTDFYAKFGLKQTKDTFTKAGKSYVIMEKRI